MELAFRKLAPQAHVRHVDVLQLTNATFRRLYGKTYFDIFHFSPHLIGYLYDFLDRPARAKNPAGDKLRLLVERANLRPFLRLLLDEPWDLVVSTHFLPAEDRRPAAPAEEVQRPPGHRQHRLRDPTACGW